MPITASMTAIRITCAGSNGSSRKAAIISAAMPMYTNPPANQPIRRSAESWKPRTSPSHSHSTPTAIRLTNSVHSGPPIHKAEPATSNITAADAIRTGRSAVFLAAVLSSAIAALPLRELRQGFFQMFRAKIGPQHIGENHFGIGRLP